MALPGLVPVNTPAGILMMAPNMAAEVQPYIDPIFDQSPQVQLGLPAETGMPVTMPPGAPGATMATPEQDRAALASAMQTEDPANLVPVSAPAPAPAPMSAPGPQAAPAPQPSALDQLLANPPSTMATSSTRRTSIPITGPNRDKIDQANQQALEAEQKKAAATGALADATTALAMREAEQSEQLARADQARRIRQDAIINDARAKRDAAFQKIPDKLDPNRWDKTGGVARVLGAIGVMLGGISQGITGRDNAAKAIMDGIVQDDLEAQRAEIELAKQEAQRADNELQDYLDLYGDPILAEKQLQIDAFGSILKQLQATMQGMQGDIAKATAAQGIAEVQGEIGRLNNEMDGRVGEMVTQSQTNPELDVRLHETAVNAELAREQAARDPFFGMNEASKRSAIERRVRLLDGSEAFARSGKAADEYLMIQEAFKQYRANMERIKEIMRTGGNVNPKSGTFKELNGLIMDNTLAVKNKEGLGALVGADWNIVDALSGKDAANWTDFDASTEQALDAMVKLAETKLLDKQRQLSRHPIESVPLGASEKRPGEDWK